MDDYYLYSGASFFVKKIIEGCSEYSNYIYATLVMQYMLQFYAIMEIKA